MQWDDVLDKLRAANLKPVEEIYMENYGKILSVQRPEFEGRYIRCTFGSVQCDGARVEVYIFPSEGHLQDFTDIIGDSAGYVPVGNIAVHSPQSSPAALKNILDAISTAPR